MLDIQYEKGFKRDYKRMVKRGCKPEKLAKIIDLLRAQKIIPVPPAPPPYKHLGFWINNPEPYFCMVRTSIDICKKKLTTYVVK